MNLELLAILEKAYQDLDLFPLLEPAEIQDFRVEYGREVLVRLKREVEASTKSGKMVFAGHRGCGKSTLLHSGGVIRELVRIARECCTECMVRLESEPDRQTVTIDDEILTIALRNLRNDFARQLGASLYQGLVRIYQTQAQLDLDGDREAFAKLLHSLCVLEYQNDDLWYDVHPIVADLLRRRELIGASEAE